MRSGQRRCACAIACGGAVKKAVRVRVHHARFARATRGPRRNGAFSETSQISRASATAAGTGTETTCSWSFPSTNCTSTRPVSLIVARRSILSASNRDLMLIHSPRKSTLSAALLQERFQAWSHAAMLQRFPSRGADLENYYNPQGRRAANAVSRAAGALRFLAFATNSCAGVDIRRHARFHLSSTFPLGRPSLRRARQSEAISGRCIEWPGICYLHTRPSAPEERRAT